MISTTVIKESIKELQELRPKQTTISNSKRLESLILYKSAQFDTLDSISKGLSISASTLDKWLSIYRKEGIDILLKIKKRKRNSKFITPEIHKGLKERVQNPKTFFNGFWDAQQWIKDTYGVDVEYQLLWHYMTYKLKAKLKIPRRSNIKKDSEATAAFLKTP